MKATIVIDPYRIIGQIDPNIYGQFLSRRRWVVDEALYDPNHPDADDTGLRKTVVKAIAESAPPIIRWPGGCTGTSYDWLDGIGPQEERSNTIDSHFGYDVTNGFGTAEFVAFCHRIGAEPHINLNTGFGTLREAMEWIEYCNYAGNSKYANLRRKHGYFEPFNVRYWQIGNENYGGWEIGANTPDKYANIVFEWGKTIKKFDKSLKVLAVGGSAKRADWDHVVLSKAIKHIDYLTAHRYWRFNTEPGNHKYDEIAAVGYVEEQTMKALGGLIDLFARDQKITKTPKLAFTEWNCINKAGIHEMSSEWRPDNTEYRMVDALAVAGFINAMQRQCNLVTLATFAQSINIGGMLSVLSDKVVRETVYWALTLQRHHSGSIAVDNWVDCGSYATTFKERAIPSVPYLDVSTTLDEKKKRLYISIINRSRNDEITTRIRLRDAIPDTDAKLIRLWHEDALAMNTLDDPDKITPQESNIKIKGADFDISLPPHSYSIIELKLKA